MSGLFRLTGVTRNRVVLKLHGFRKACHKNRLKSRGARHRGDSPQSNAAAHQDDIPKQTTQTLCLAGSVDKRYIQTLGNTGQGHKWKDAKEKAVNRTQEYVETQSEAKR